MADITVRSLSKSYGEKTVLSDFSAVFPAHGAVCLMGASGSGKTTLLRLLLGLEKPDGGEIAGMPARAAVVFQEDRLCEDLTAEENVRLTSPAAPRDEITALLASLGLSESAGQPVRTLSGGMKRRVAIARALAYGGDLYLFDEPFKGLDEATRDAVTDVILARTAGAALICVTHDPGDAARLGAVTRSL